MSIFIYYCSILLIIMTRNPVPKNTLILTQTNVKYIRIILLFVAMCYLYSHFDF